MASTKENTSIPAQSTSSDWSASSMADDPNTSLYADCEVSGFLI